ncbi:DUF6691 family protein [Gammaproteobacteria bacterium AS21]
MNRIMSLISGLLFGAGLAASGMTNTAKVTGFLDIFGNWDPDLLLVMASAVITTLICFRFVLKRSKPVFASSFSLPLKTVIDLRLLLGAVLFGIGWGLYGYCPGPAVAAIVYLQPVTGAFLIAMLLGMFIASKIPKS